MALSLDEKIRRAKARYREKSKAETVARRALKRAEDASERAFFALDDLEYQKACLRLATADRAGKNGPLIVLAGQEYVLYSVEMLPLNPKGWRFRFRKVGDASYSSFGADAHTPTWKVYQWGGPKDIDWEAHRAVLIEALQRGTSLYAIMARSDMREVA